MRERVSNGLMRLVRCCLLVMLLIILAHYGARHVRPVPAHRAPAHTVRSVVSHRNH